MFRAFHRWAGVSASLLLVIVALTGAILSIFPVFSADRTAARLNAGDLVVAVQQAIPGAEQIVVDDNGIMSAVSFGANGLEQTLVDPATGSAMGAVQSSQLELWFENLHRALFLSDTGHLVVLIVTIAWWSCRSLAISSRPVAWAAGASYSLVIVAKGRAVCT